MPNFLMRYDVVGKTTGQDFVSTFAYNVVSFISVDRVFRLFTTLMESVTGPYWDSYLCVGDNVAAHRCSILSPDVSQRQAASFPWFRAGSLVSDPQPPFITLRFPRVGTGDVPLVVEGTPSRNLRGSISLPSVATDAITDGQYNHGYGQYVSAVTLLQLYVVSRFINVAGPGNVPFGATLRPVIVSKRKIDRETGRYASQSWNFNADSGRLGVLRSRQPGHGR